jgi:hypothetical protein
MLNMKKWVLMFVLMSTLVSAGFVNGFFGEQPVREKYECYAFFNCCLDAGGVGND